MKPDDDGFDDAECDDFDEDARGWYSDGSDLWGWWAATHADDACDFLLGAHLIQWIWNGLARGPLFISARRLATRKSRFPRATVPFCIDSGGFTELRDFGRWTVSASDYVGLVRRVSDETLGVAWAAIQDWMCEPRHREWPPTASPSARFLSR